VLSQHLRHKQTAYLRQPVPELAEQVLPGAGWYALAATLADAEATGHAPAALLTEAAGRRELQTAESVSDVLVRRLRRMADLPAEPRRGREQPESPGPAAGRRPPRSCRRAGEVCTRPADMVRARLAAWRSPAEGGVARVERNRYADLLRVCAIGAVVLGHWLVTDVTYRGGRLSGLDALQYVSWGRWITLLFQVMPVFFMVGGYANAVSWTAHQRRGEDWPSWLRGRALRLLWPTTVYVVAAVLIVAGAGISGVNVAGLAQAAWFVALHLWFLPVYLLLITLTPVLLAAHRRCGLVVPAVMAGGAAAVDAAVLGPHLPLIGFANYLLVWGAMHQWGFAWQDGSLTRPRWRPYALTAAGTALLAVLLAWGPFPVDMIGAGGRVGNTSPPSIALLAFAAAQTGLLLAAESAGVRLLARARGRRLVSRLNSTVMTVYLWHMAPVIVVALTLYPTGVMPEPPIGSAHWWELRPAWLALLTAVMVPLTAALMRAQRPLLHLPAGLGSPRRWSPALLLCGIAAAALGLSRLAIAGFSPGGHLPWLVLAAYASGLLGTLLWGHPPPGNTVTGPQTPQPHPTRRLPAPPIPGHIRFRSRGPVTDRGR